MGTKEEAIDFLRNIYSWPLLKLWLERDYGCTNGTTTESIKVTRHMLTHAVPYEVMLAKMLRAVPIQLERLQVVSEKDEYGGGTLLHVAAKLGNPESIRTVLALYPESERLKALGLRDENGCTVLHCAISSNRAEST